MNSSRTPIKFPGAFGTSLAVNLDLLPFASLALELYVHGVAYSNDTPDEAQRVRLVEIADKWTVHRTLHAEVQVQTRLDR